MPAWDHPEVVGNGEASFDVPMPDGGTIRVLRVGKAHDPRDKGAALRLMHEDAASPEYFTGIFYIQSGKPTLPEFLNVVAEPLATLPEERVRPSEDVLAQINDSYR